MSDKGKKYLYGNISIYIQRTRIVPANSAIYYGDSTLKMYYQLDRQQSNVKYAAGDIICKYCSRPYQRIVYQLELAKVKSLISNNLKQLFLIRQLKPS
jgi:hypothetical protein